MVPSFDIICHDLTFFSFESDVRACCKCLASCEHDGSTIVAAVTDSSNTGIPFVVLKASNGRPTERSSHGGHGSGREGLRMELRLKA